MGPPPPLDLEAGSLKPTRSGSMLSIQMESLHVDAESASSCYCRFEPASRGLWTIRRSSVRPPLGLAQGGAKSEFVRFVRFFFVDPVSIGVFGGASLFLMCCLLGWGHIIRTLAGRWIKADMHMDSCEVLYFFVKTLECWLVYSFLPYLFVDFLVGRQGCALHDDEIFSGASLAWMAISTLVASPF